MVKLVICLLLTMIISYLLGSCNSAIIVVRCLKHEDIREHGSKNAGLTNTLRCYGKIPALLTLIGDLAKGIIAVLLSILMFRLIIGSGFPNELPNWYPPVLDEISIGYISGFLRYSVIFSRFITVLKAERESLLHRLYLLWSIRLHLQ